MEKPVKTVLGIPGHWRTRDEIVTAIARDSQGFIFAGRVLLELATQQFFEIEIRAHDPHLREAFKIAAQGRLDTPTLEAIARHTYTVYIIGNGGTPTVARNMMRAAAGVLRAGGLAVKVESSGAAHSVKGWQSLIETTDDIALYYAYVTLVGGLAPTEYYSCGMHNLGLRDAMVFGELDPQEAGAVLQTFLLYTLLEHPDLASGHTFSVDANSPRYIVQAIKCTTYPEDDLFFNPFGLWQLVRQAPAPQRKR